jgi:hypothetical protein
VAGQALPEQTGRALALQQGEQKKDTNRTPMTRQGDGFKRE